MSTHTQPLLNSLGTSDRIGSSMKTHVMKLVKLIRKGAAGMRAEYASYAVLSSLLLLFYVMAANEPLGWHQAVP